MPRWPSTPCRFPRAALARVAGLVCGLLACWAGVDQLLLPQVAPGHAPPSVPQDDDDDMAASPAGVRVDEPAPPVKGPTSPAAPGRPHRPLARAAASAPAREHDFRNGVGAPLLC